MVLGESRIAAEAAPPSAAVALRRYAAWIVGLLVVLATTWAALDPFRHSLNWLVYEQDDFFYYLKVAQNIAAGHGSTFNQIVPTNGYHPLWMAALVAVLKLGVGSHGLLVFLQLTLWLATIGTYCLCLRLLRRSGVELLLSATLSAYVTIYAAHVYSGRMEVTLALPLMLVLLLLLQEISWWTRSGFAGLVRSLIVGLVLSLMVLARLDTLIFAVLVAAGVVLQPSLRRSLRLNHLAGLALGLLPLAAYFLANHHFFGIWMPVSGIAKQLKLDHGFTARAWQSTFIKSSAQRFNSLPILLAVAALPWLWKRLQPSERAFVPAALVFPFLYIGLLSWLSDWYLWSWYFYAFRLGLCVALLVLLKDTRLARVLSWTPITLLLALGILSRLPTLAWSEKQPAILDAALDIQHFALTRPGIYAMGDRSGVVGYLVPDPVIQTEGLMMDRDFLAQIAQQRPLRQVLAAYNVRYYVGTAMTPYTGCFQASEPFQAGPHAPHMRADFCERPVALWQHGGIETLVFDLQPGKDRDDLAPRSDP